MHNSWRLTALISVGLLASCTKGNGAAHISHDMASADLLAADLSMSGTDLASRGDLGATGDLATAADLSSTTPVDIGACTPNTFAYCQADDRTAVYCNASGTGGTSFDCGIAGCLGPSGCGQCVADSCKSGSFVACDTQHQKASPPVQCETLSKNGNSKQCATPTRCGPECTGTFVCGNGAYGTVVNSSYACTAMVVGAGVACAFGCDNATGQCRDLVPANAAADHLSNNDGFTCTGTQNGKLAAITGANGDTITFYTTTNTVTKSTGPGPVFVLPGILWGGAYTPSNGHTSVITAHIRSLSLSAGAHLVVSGSNALALLVDQSVGIAGAPGMPTIIDLSAHYTGKPEFPTVAGPGAGVGNKHGQGNAGTAANQSAGSGGGYGVAGGQGGDGNGGTTQIAGGAAFPGSFVLESGGYGGGADYDHAGKGGGGLQITACGDLSISTSVVINASGGGGKAGGVSQSSGGGAPPIPSPSPLGGFGGGAGGTILVEAATMATLGGELVANGGGGGQGGILPSAINSAQDGADWNLSSAYNAPAAGGGAVAAPGAGGAGGAGSIAPSNGGNGAHNGAGGAGGGAYGQIFIALSPISPTVLGALTTSPTAVVSKTCVTTGGVKPGTCTYP